MDLNEYKDENNKNYKKTNDELDDLKKAVDILDESKAGTTKEYSMPSCAHILDTYPKAKNGIYFIDPNKGSTKDAVQVYCDMVGGGVTVVATTQKPIPLGGYRTGSGDRKTLWSSIKGMSKFRYNISDNQLAFLQSISSAASQVIEFKAVGVIIFRYQQHPTMDKQYYHGAGQVIFSGWNGESIRGSHGNSYSIEKNPHLLFSAGPDTCQKNSGPCETRITIATKEVRAMPVTDFSLYDMGDPSELYGFELSAVRFTTRVRPYIGQTLARPAKNCRHILEEYPNAPDGDYYIKVLTEVHLLRCDMTCSGSNSPCAQHSHSPGMPNNARGWTCVPARRNVPMLQWNLNRDGRRWFATQMSRVKGYYLTYVLNTKELNALQDLSSQAKQILKISCADVIAWMSGTGNDYNDAAMFRSATNVIWGYGRGALTPLVYWHEDECRKNSRNPSEQYRDHTTFRFENGDTKSLPIVDFNLRDIGNNGEKFGMDVGDVCFL
eukprot:m.345335 g.345335  ORF g.345335 m.345335 type:complete len:493 (+) comp26136_c0_seq1:228-1706(+)